MSNKTVIATAIFAALSTGIVVSAMTPVFAADSQTEVAQGLYRQDILAALMVCTHRPRVRRASPREVLKGSLHILR